MPAKQSKRERILFFLAAVMIPVLLMIIFTRLFYDQIKYPDFYKSDISAHIKIAAQGRGYSFLYGALGLIIHASGGRYQSIIIAAFEGLMTVLTVYPMAAWMVKRFHIQKWTAYLAAAGLLFCSSIYLPVLQPLFYKSGIVTQPWHNITYMGMRLFAIMTMCGFSDVLDRYQEKISVKDWLKIAIPLAVSTGIKPVFLLAFSWALLLFLIIDAIRGKFRGRVLIQCVKLGTTVFPSLILLYIQSRILYGSGSSGIRFSLTASTFFANGFSWTLIKLLRALLLAVIVMLYNRSDQRKATGFVYVLYLVALFQVIMFSETGPRENHGNFYWILYICGFILYGHVIANWIKNIKENNWQTTKDKWYGTVTSVLTLAHLISGIAYFVMINLYGKYSL